MPLSKIRAAIIASIGIFAVSQANAASKTFLIGSFEELTVEGDITVIFNNRKAPSAKASGDRTVLDSLKFEQNGMQLRIRVQEYQGRPRIARADEPLVINLGGRNVTRVTANGAATVRINEVIADNGQTRFRVSGPGTITLDRLESDRVSMIVYGSGEVAIGSGRARAAQIVIDGTGSISARQLALRQAELTQKGNARTHLSVSDNIEITNQGAGSITVDGKATCFVRQAGSAKISCEKATLK
ncbi:MAG: GIN domain-containing protein [Sphingorhabdus sp.]